MSRQITKQEVLEMMKRAGPRELIAQAERELPDYVDLERDQPLLERFGVGRSQLLERFGASP